VLRVRVKAMRGNAGGGTMDITAERTEWGTLLRVSGCLDVSSKKQFLDTPCIQECEAPLIVDLAQMDFLDSSGLGALVQSIRRFRDSGKPFVLASPTEAVLRLLKLMSVDQIVAIADNMELAESVVMQGR
jgi:anti-sigma B factor antagonist